MKIIKMGDPNKEEEAAALLNSNEQISRLEAVRYDNGRKCNRCPASNGNRKR